MNRTLLLQLTIMVNLLPGAILRMLDRQEVLILNLLFSLVDCLPAASLESFEVEVLDS